MLALQLNHIAKTHQATTGPLRLIMVVDDSRVQRKILSSQLARAGYQVIEAGRGEEALVLLECNDPGLIISDWMMTGMTGLEFCAHLGECERGRYA